MSVLTFLFSFVLGLTIVHTWDWKKVSIADVQAEIRSGKSCVTVIQRFLDRIDQFDWELNSLVLKSPFALADAEDMDRKRLKTGKLVGSLHCVPVLPKDNIDVGGLPTSVGLDALNRSIPNFHADVIHALQSAGAVVIGKAAMAPLAGEARFTMTKRGGITMNPYSLYRTTFGSSGGNAAAGAAVFALVGVGTDTAGSIMLPAAATGLMALRPPMDRISTNGIFPMNKFQETVGPMVRWAEDLALVMDVLDSSAERVNYSSYETLDLNGLDGQNIALIKDLTFSSLNLTIFDRAIAKRPSRELRRLVNVAVMNLRSSGANVTLTRLDMPYAMTYLNKMLTVSSKLRSCIPEWIGEYLGNRFRFPPGRPFHDFEALMESQLLPSHVREAFEAAYKVKGDCNEAMKNFTKARKRLVDNLITPAFGEDIDFLMYPATNYFPPKLDQTEGIDLSGAILAPFAGYPSLTLPIGFSKPQFGAEESLPAALILVAKPDKMDALVKVAYAYQKRYGDVRLPATVSDSQRVSLWNFFLLVIIICWGLSFGSFL